MSQESAAQLVESTPLKHAFGISQEMLDQVMATAYRMYKDGRFTEAEILCRGLLSADPHYWWCYSLYAAILRRRGRLLQAIAMLDRGLRHEPGQPKLIEMRKETLATLQALAALSEQATAAPATTASAKQEVLR